MRRGIGCVVVRKRGGFVQYSEIFVTLNEYSPVSFESVPDSSNTILEFESGSAFPCSGFINSDSIGWIFAPLMTVDLGSFTHIMILPLETAPSKLNFNPARPSLSSSSKERVGNVRIIGGKEIVGDLTLSGGPLDQLVLSMHRFPIRFKEQDHRSLGMSTYHTEQVAELMGDNGKSFVWHPAEPTFAPTAWICNPIVYYKDFFKMLQSIGGPSNSTRLSSEFLFGDSKAFQYAMKLTLKSNGAILASEECPITVS